jgi:dienelactone hydrolase/Flp pilus assembly protein TadD
MGAALAATVLLSACEKETHRAARAEFQTLMARTQSEAEQARDLEAFVQRFPEPKTNPYLTRAEVLLAEYHARAEEFDIAASWYERAVRANPNDPDLLNALGYLYASRGMNLDRAVTVLESAVRLAEERGAPPRRLGFIKDSLGWAHRMRGDLPLAVAVLEEADRLAPDVPIIRSHLADSYRAIGEREKAADILLRLLLQTRGTDPELRRALDEVGREGGRRLSGELSRRLEEGMRQIAETDRRAASAQGAALVRIKADDGVSIAGSLFLPDGPAPPRAGGPAGRVGAVLLLHALASSRLAAAPTARALAARGLVALTIDLRGHGGSVTEALPGPRQFRENLAANIETAGRDARAGLAYLQRLRRVDPARLGIVGAGLGALLAARTADSAPDPPALVLISPWGRADAYEPHLTRLDAGSLLLIRGADERAIAPLMDRLVASFSSAIARTHVVEGEGAGYGLLDLDGNVAHSLSDFLANRLGGGRPDLRRLRGDFGQERSPGGPPTP